MVKQKKTERFRKALDETIKIPDKKGNGILKFSAEIDSKGLLRRYSLVYINTRICNKDNGRVLGYDNDHGYHHRHYMGQIERTDFSSFEDVKNRFESEWRALHEKHQKSKR